MALEAEGDEAVDVSLVAFEAGLSMEWVSDLCCTPLFYHRCRSSYRHISAPQRHWKTMWETTHGSFCREL